MVAALWIATIGIIADHVFIGMELRRCHARFNRTQFWFEIVRTHSCFLHYYPYLSDLWERDGKPELP
ncbi:MAG TPA: hypothetical protein VGE59_00390 [Patescibacteria group bacterium]